MRVGVLGGTFDPVHLGHLIIAQEAMLKLSLKRVIFVPAGQPWFKADSDVTTTNHRLEMLRLALRGNPHFRIDTQELERPGPTYTVDTITQLRSTLGPKAEVFFIMGLDALAELHRWKEPGRLVQMCCFATMKRPGYTALDFSSLERQVPGVTRKIYLLENLQVDISSSDIRSRVQGGLPIRYLVPGPVERYIQAKGLYRNETGGSRG